MPHLRDRHAIKVVLKKLSFSPVVSIQGARQIGKSVLSRDLLSKKIPNIKYLTLDESSIKKFAKSNPDTLLESNGDYRPIIIDEAQKVPSIFDAIKLSVDRKRIPGKFILLGSTEFSIETNIRESLTGRLSRVSLYPLMASEAFELKPEYRILSLDSKASPRIQRGQFLKFIDRGGLPGIFSVRSESARLALMKDLLDLIVRRDIFQFQKLRLDSDLCLEILTAAARCENPNQDQIAKYVQENSKRVATHLKALKQLFVLHGLKPHKLGAGKEKFYLFDSGLAAYLGASFKRKLEISFLNELLASIQYSDFFPSQIQYYATSRGSQIDFIVECKGKIRAIKIVASESFDKRDYVLLESLRQKSRDISLYALGPTELKYNGVKQLPWEAVL